VASPTKAGSEREIVRLQAALRDHCEVWLVENDRDGSGMFAPFRRITVPRWHIQYLEPALMGARWKSPTMLDFIYIPPDGYQMAAGLVVHWLETAARASGAMEILGTGAVGILPRLEEMAIHRPTRWNRGMRNASDRALMVESIKAVALARLHRLPANVADADLLEAARGNVRAHAVREAIPDLT
jgi:hypothetical protein